MKDECGRVNRRAPVSSFIIHTSAFKSRRHPPAREQSHHRRSRGDRCLHRRWLARAGHPRPAARRRARRVETEAASRVSKESSLDFSPNAPCSFGLKPQLHFFHGCRALVLGNRGSGVSWRRKWGGAHHRAFIASVGRLARDFTPAVCPEIRTVRPRTRGGGGCSRGGRFRGRRKWRGAA